jgi:hypothetical protein
MDIRHVTLHNPPLEGEGRPRKRPEWGDNKKVHPLPTPPASTSPLQGEVKTSIK